MLFASCCAPATPHSKHGHMLPREQQAHKCGLHTPCGKVA